MNDRLYQRESEAISKMATLLARHVVPLFFDDQHGKPQRCGSGFLVSAGTLSYLISAAHVFDAVKKGHEPYYYIGPKTKRKLSGSARLTRSPSQGGRLRDKFDIGVLRLEGPGLPPYPAADKYPLPVATLRPSALPREGKQYLLVGFPGTKTSLDRAKKQITTKLYSYRNVSCPTDRYSSIGIAPQTHLAISFDRQKSLGADANLRMFPDPTEMSGSPVWLLYDERGPNDPKQTPVVGVAIEHRANHRAIVATDIGLALEYIRAV